MDTEIITLHNMKYNTVQGWEYIWIDDNTYGHPMNNNALQQEICDTWVYHTDSYGFSIGYGHFFDNFNIDNGINKSCYAWFKNMHFQKLSYFIVMFWWKSSLKWWVELIQLGVLKVTFKRKSFLWFIAPIGKGVKEKGEINNQNNSLVYIHSEK